MGFIKGHLTPARIAWNRFKYRFTAWITMGRVELQFKEYAPKTDDGQLPYEETDDTFPGPPLVALPRAKQPAFSLSLETVPEPGPEADIAPLLAVNAKFHPKMKVRKNAKGETELTLSAEDLLAARRIRPKSGHIRPTKRGGSPKSRFRK